MELLRRYFLQSTSKQSELIEIFEAIARDHSGRITFEEFHAAIRSLELGFDHREQTRQLFRQFDKTNNGQIDLAEFLFQLRPPLNARRERAVGNLFNALDVNHDGKLTIADLKVKYASQLKKIQSSEKIDQVCVRIALLGISLYVATYVIQILGNFLHKFETPGKEDGMIDKEEFLGFCSMLSATIKEDIYFEHVLRTLFELHF